MSATIRRLDMIIRIFLVVGWLFDTIAFSVKKDWGIASFSLLMTIVCAVLLALPVLREWPFDRRRGAVSGLKVKSGVPRTARLFDRSPPPRRDPSPSNGQPLPDDLARCLEGELPLD
jgi:hypothetical protein